MCWNDFLLVSFLAYRFHVFFIKSRAFYRGKKSIKSCDIICLTFSSLGVMNGKVRKQLIKCVDGKHSSWKVCCVYKGLGLGSFSVIQLKNSMNKYIKMDRQNMFPSHECELLIGKTFLQPGWEFLVISLALKHKRSPFNTVTQRKVNCSDVLFQPSLTRKMCNRCIVDLPNVL